MATNFPLSFPPDAVIVGTSALTALTLTSYGDIRVYIGVEDPVTTHVTRTHMARVLYDGSAAVFEVRVECVDDSETFKVAQYTFPGEEMFGCLAPVRALLTLSASDHGVKLPGILVDTLVSVATALARTQHKPVLDVMADYILSPDFSTHVIPRVKYIMGTTSMKTGANPEGKTKTKTKTKTKAKSAVIESETVVVPSSPIETGGVEAKVKPNSAPQVLPSAGAVAASLLAPNEPATQVKVETAKATTTVKYPNGATVNGDETVGEPVALVNPCNVGVRFGRTINTGNYENLRIEVSINVPCPHAEVDGVFVWAKQWADSKLSSLIDEVTTAMAGDALAQPPARSA